MGLPHSRVWTGGWCGRVVVSRQAQSGALPEKALPPASPCFSYLPEPCASCCLPDHPQNVGAVVRFCGQLNPQWQPQVRGELFLPGDAKAAGAPACVRCGERIVQLEAAWAFPSGQEGPQSCASSAAEQKPPCLPLPTHREHGRHARRAEGPLPDATSHFISDLTVSSWCAQGSSEMSSGGRPLTVQEPRSSEQVEHRKMKMFPLLHQEHGCLSDLCNGGSAQTCRVGSTAAPQLRDLRRFPAERGNPSHRQASPFVRKGVGSLGIPESCALNCSFETC